MGRLKADLDTLQRVRVVLADAMQRGLDAAEALDTAGLLFHHEKRRQIAAQTVEAFAQAVDEASVDHIARLLSERQATSPGEMKRQIVSYMRDPRHTAMRGPK